MNPGILLIVGNDQNRSMTTSLLEKHGHEVVQTVDRPRGIALAATVQPRLILLAIQPPLMDGCKVTREPRHNTELSRIPIVAVTSHAMMGDWE